MKIPLAAFTLTLIGLSPTATTAPEPKPAAPTLDVRPVLMMDPMEFGPSIVSEQPVPMSALREQAAGSAGLRLARLDDRVTHLKARADQSIARLQLEQEFTLLKHLRAQVTTALTNLKNPELGYHAAQKTLDDAMDALDLAISAVVMKLERLDHAEPPRVS